MNRLDIEMIEHVGQVRAAAGGLITIVEDSFETHRHVAIGAARRRCAGRNAGQRLSPHVPRLAVECRGCFEGAALGRNSVHRRALVGVTEGNPDE